MRPGEAPDDGLRGAKPLHRTSLEAAVSNAVFAHGVQMHANPETLERDSEEDLTGVPAKSLRQARQREQPQKPPVQPKNGDSRPLGLTRPSS